MVIAARTLLAFCASARLISKLCLTFTISLLISPALAQSDGTDVVGLRTGGLTLTNDAGLARVSETLRITPSLISADYRFRNNSDKSVSSLIVFRMPDIAASAVNADAGDPQNENFLDYHAQQDGVEIQPVLQWRAFLGSIDLTDLLVAAKVPPNPLSDAARSAINDLPGETIKDWLTLGLIVADVYCNKADCHDAYLPGWTMKSAYWWRAQFPAGREADIRFRYAPSVGHKQATSLVDGVPFKDVILATDGKGYCPTTAVADIVKHGLQYSGGEPAYGLHLLSYGLASEAGPYGSIGTFTLQVQPEPGTEISFCSPQLERGASENTWTARDFRPEKDLEILFLVPTNFE